MWKCKHCFVEFDGFSASQKANHSRWCDKNPKRDSYNLGCPQFKTKEAVEKRISGIKQAHKDGRYKGNSKKSLETKRINGTLKHTVESRRKISEAARKSSHRRLVRSIRPYQTKNGDVVILDSSWEEALAVRLDELEVEWCRPKEPIEYTDGSGVNRKYFPDFYLPKFDLFLDPKNSYAIFVQREKLEIIKRVVPNLRIICSLEDCKKFTV